MKRSFSIILLSTLIIFSSIEALIPPAAVGTASLLFARRFTVSVVIGDFLINLGRLSERPKDPTLTLQDKTGAILNSMNKDFFDACQGVDYITKTAFNAAEEIFKKAQKEKPNSSAKKPTDPEDIKKEEDANEEKKN